MKTILITGGCGFIGSNFIRYLLQQYRDYHIINIDKLTYCGNRANLRDIEKSDRYEFVQGDICDRKLIFDITPRVSTVINFAAETHVDRSIEDAAAFMQTNIEGVRCLLDAARKHAIERFIHISTDEVYGSIQTGAFTEESALFPNSPYAASKAAGDLLARAYYITYGVPVIIIRSCNNFGPYQYPEKVIPLFITNVLEGEKVPLYGEGQNVREWIYVEDNCRAIDIVVHKGSTGEIYNVGSEDALANIELARRILLQLGKADDWIKHVPDRPGHDFRYSLADEKVRRLGYQPQYTFYVALQKTIQWYTSHSEWWQPLKNNKYTKK